MHPFGPIDREAPVERAPHGHRSGPKGQGFQHIAAAADAGIEIDLGALDLHPLGFSVDVRDVTLTQDGHPDPPVARVPQLSAGVQWRALLRARVVADVRVERPALHLNLTQLLHEARDEVPVRERGWQEAVQAVSPLEINEVQIVEGEVTYVDQDTSRPIRLRQLNVRAGNIRNV
jgi:uncharacterized protein involved in outer membrane biogenesis